MIKKIKINSFEIIIYTNLKYISKATKILNFIIKYNIYKN